MRCRLHGLGDRHRCSSLDQSGGPLQVDAWGASTGAGCRALGVRRVVLSSLCAGRWLHPLNLFGLILVWKRVGERCLERSVWIGL